MTGRTSFAKDNRPLFTQQDIQGMRLAFDLADYAAVKVHAHAISDRIQGIGGIDMPPPPPLGNGPWPRSNIDLFARWVDDECPP